MASLFSKEPEFPCGTFSTMLIAGENVKDFLKDFPTVSFEQIRLVLQSAEVAIENSQAA